MNLFVSLLFLSRYTEIQNKFINQYFFINNILQENMESVKFFKKCNLFYNNWYSVFLYCYDVGWSLKMFCIMVIAVEFL